MGHQDALTPGLKEGEISGGEFNALNGRRYTYQGHYLGSRTITYRVTVLDANLEHRGDLAGTFERIDFGTDPATTVGSLVKSAIRRGAGYRP